MHEYTAVASAIEGAIEGWDASRPAARLDLVVRDPTRADADSVAFYASAILAERGLAGVRVDVRVEAIPCIVCGSSAAPSPTSPVCPACGSPWRRLPGPALTACAREPGRRIARCA